MTSLAVRCGNFESRVLGHACSITTSLAVATNNDNNIKTRTCTCTYIHRDACMHVHMHVRTHTRTHAPIDTCTQKHTCTHYKSGGLASKLALGGIFRLRAHQPVLSLTETLVVTAGKHTCKYTHVCPCTCMQMHACKHACRQHCAVRRRRQDNQDWQLGFPH